MDYTQGQIKTMIAMHPRKRTEPCLFLVTIDKPVMPTDGSSEIYYVRSYQCNKEKPHSIGKSKSRCKRCLKYVPVTYDYDEDY